MALLLLMAMTEARLRHSTWDNQGDLQPDESPYSALNYGPSKLIIDTDIGGGACRDVDDVLAVCMAHALADRGEADILAIVVDSLPSAGAGVVSVLNRWYGRDYIPLGPSFHTPTNSPVPVCTG